MNLQIKEFESKYYDEMNILWQLTDMGGAYRGDNLEIIHNSIKMGGALYLLFDNEIMIGTSWITNDGRRLYLHHFCIHPDYQGKGLSKLLMDKSMEFARKVGLQIKLEVHRENIVARNLYDKYAFKYLGDYDIFIVREY
ncbi:MAG: GNAT family N-acetyltransferase [Bacteroidales bacterium]|jgi:ribosomal protein S18 acetylase RimI-like enzyme|nr:GNAT family N-acetyltransferase [Bacteroidales bacterium]MCK9498519.1 GNAT family N-acetyltransferase [Bacteroidales bacterium]MDY0314264.1 GNAT family N-acetyltransferase [Bacteroidales bacterium]NLB86038.1 GNAT family N-acetyltransferase [Bacteroidales bacterium]